MRRTLVAGNAKMFLSRETLRDLLTTLTAELASRPVPAEVLYCPAFTLLDTARSVLEGTPVALGAQNLYCEASGAYTGEVSPAMIREAGCTHVILGHSERRHLFGETSDLVRRKVAAALEAGLIPIVCVGETEAERDRGETEAVLTGQVRESLAGVTPAGPGALVVAYEPVWAIGTGKTATPGEAQEAQRHVRHQIETVLGSAMAAEGRILYGGSVKPGNARELLDQPDIDGALVGGASLDAESFLGILRA